MFSWFGDTAGALVGPFGFVIVLVPAAVEALAFAACAALSAHASARLPYAQQPIAFAAAFTVCEWARSSGTFGVPFAQLGVSQVAGPLAPLGAYAGAYGITFCLCLLSGYLFVALADPGSRRVAAGALAAVALASLAAWWWWPARVVPAPSIPVAAVQGNVVQGLKWTPAAVDLGIARYIAMTDALIGRGPRIVVWPETVVAEFLSGDPPLRARLSALARTLGAPIVVGSLDEVDPQTYFNALFIFAPDGTTQVYHKHQLVPFAEFLPAASLLGRMPGAEYISRFTAAPAVGVERAGGLAIGPLLCWESAFAELAYDEVREGAQVLVVSTDDGWFGTTSGPYQHAEIAQMRAIETGRWVIRAAATGISEIVAPDGRVTGSVPIGVQATLASAIGPPQPTAFDAIGPNAIALACALLYLALILIPRRRAA